MKSVVKIIIIKPLNQNNMKTPIIILMVLWAINLLTVAYLHGKEKSTTHNIFNTIIAQSINIGLLYWAGLFD